MSDDAAFLGEIRASPGDPSRRLAYAEWLDDRGDPRGELVRVEEEMRQVPVFADRFWDRKPRRDALRAQAAPEWLERMGYGTTCHPLFRHGWPDGPKERWRLIREYTERWWRFSLSDVGGQADAIREVESRLGRTLPPSIREWVAFAHDVRDPPQGIVIRDVYEIEELEAHSALSLLLQGEADYRWAVRLEDLDLPDPPVQGFRLDYDSPNESDFEPDPRSPLADTVSRFVIDYVTSYTYGEGGGFRGGVEDPSRLIRDLRAWFPVHCRLGESEVFEAEDIMVSLSPGPRGDHRIAAHLARPMPREAIPPFLWGCTRNGGCFHGMFTPDGPGDPDAR